MSQIFARIAIVGRKRDTTNYVNAFSDYPISVFSTLSKSEYSSADALILPGGGDIDPIFLQEENIACHSIDTELDITQLQALNYFVLQKKPILGICKGLQLINLFFGGTLYQDLPTASHHKWIGKDQLHPSIILENTPLWTLYGASMMINSAHHQGINLLGSHLILMQKSEDNVVEGIYHNSLPILGVQWHPERYSLGLTLLEWFVSLVNESCQSKT